MNPGLRRARIAAGLFALLVLPAIFALFLVDEGSGNPELVIAGLIFGIPLGFVAYFSRGLISREEARQFFSDRKKSIGYRVGMFLLGVLVLFTLLAFYGPVPLEWLVPVVAALLVANVGAGLKLLIVGTRVESESKTGDQKKHVSGRDWM